MLHTPILTARPNHPKFDTAFRDADDPLAMVAMHTSRSEPAGAHAPPLPLSIAIVCRSNQRTIARTLESVRGLARQVVAVDSGSTDSTLDILESHGAEVHHREWLGHIRTKQVALDLCREEWILCLDSDESLEPALQRAVREAIARNDPSIAGYQVNRKVWWAGALLNHAWQPEWRLRLVRRGRARWGGYDPHDALQITAAPGQGARIERLPGDLRHDSFETMAEHLAAQVRHAQVAARSYARLGRRPSTLNLVFSPIGAWLKQMLLRHAWRDGWRGWSAASATAAATLMKHLIFLEESRRADTQPAPDPTPASSARSIAEEKPEPAPARSGASS